MSLAPNTVLSTARQRFHDAAGTGELGTPSSGVGARVSYAASWYDSLDRLTASVDVGTNGGTAYTRTSSPPARSDAALVSDLAYDAAGRLKDVTDPRGILSRTSYDLLGRVVKSVRNYADGTPSAADNKTVTNAYDSAGRYASLTVNLPGGGQQQTV